MTGAPVPAVGSPEGSRVEELDLTGDPPASDAKAPSTVPYDPAIAREQIRGWVAVGLVGLLGVVVIGSFVLLATGSLRIADLKELLSVVFTPLVALVSAAIGFYFGGKGRS